MEKYYLAALNFVAECGPNRTKVLMKHFKNAENIWRASAQDLLSNQFVSTDMVDSIIDLRNKGIVENLAKTCHKEGISIVSYLDEDYPEQLYEVYNFPATLFYKGKNLQAIKNPLGVVGPRKSSAYAQDVVKFFIGKLAKYDFSIISGGARGIDTTAHRMALEHGLHTVAVLGCGLDITYPPENGKLFAEIAERGTLLSEYPPGVKPLSHNFPARNRLISGLSSGVLLPEAGKKSGSLITAEFALDQGREVYCVPGSIFLDNSLGVHSLIKQGAKLTNTPEDILEDYFPEKLLSRKKSMECQEPELIKQTELLQASAEHNQQELSAEQIAVLQVLRYDLPMNMDTIHIACDLEIGLLNLALLELEILGYIYMDTRQRKYLKVKGVE